MQTLYDFSFTGAKADSSDEEPEEEICFSVEEGNMNKKSAKKIGNISSPEDGEFSIFNKAFTDKVNVIFCIMIWNFLESCTRKVYPRKYIY